MRKTEETCSKYVGPVKFNGIPREGKPAISIQSCRDQCLEHIIRNGMWDVFYIADSQNKEKEWDLLLHHSKFHLEYVKGLVQSLLKGSEADQDIVQNLTWSGVYLIITLSDDLLQKVLDLVPLTATGPEVYVATMSTIISDFYYYLTDTLNQMKSLKLKDNHVEDTADYYNAILENVESLESAGSFKPEHIGYIISIFENAYDSRFNLWETQKRASH